MIDEKKYEGHTPTEKWVWNAENYDILTTLFHRDSQGGRESGNESDAMLIVDAPDLLAEVKRLQICIAEVVDVVQNCNYLDREDYFNHFCEVHAELAGNIFHAGDVILGGGDI
jgi:hypothetical protein